MSKIDSKKLVELFEKAFNNSVTYRRIGDATNPFHIIFDGVEYYIYIKNVSSAHFDNPDVWRAQMTEREELQAIKETDAIFILLGYDDTNDVYVTWNPHQLKQRIGTAKSPSLYSRLSIQKEVARTGTFVKKNLNNDQEVLVFRREQIIDYLVNLDQFFSDTSEYVAIGSRRRTEANDAYRELISLKRISAFEQYLIDDTGDEEFARSYARAMRLLVNDNYISKNRKLFLACNSVGEYMNAYKSFLALDEIKSLDEDKNHVITDALEMYILFLQEDNDIEGTREENDQEMELPEEKMQEKYGSEETAEITDWETPFLDNNGNLTRIANPKLLELLEPDLHSEYQSLPAAYNTILEFYGENRFPNMQMKDWNHLFKVINWDKPFLPCGETGQSSKQKYNSRQKIRVILKDGTIINENQVVNTLIKVVKYAGVENVRRLNINMGKNGGGLLIDTEVNPKYVNAFKSLGNGLYLNTCSNTITKLRQLIQINEGLQLGLDISLI